MPEEQNQNVPNTEVGKALMLKTLDFLRAQVEAGGVTGLLTIFCDKNCVPTPAFIADPSGMMALIAGIEIAKSDVELQLRKAIANYKAVPVMKVPPEGIEIPDPSKGPIVTN